MPNQTSPPQAQQPAATTPRPKVRPRTDVYETDDALILIADVPGADEGSIELALSEDVLTLRARAAVAMPEGWQPAGAEFELPDYERSFRLTTEIDRDGLAAKIHDGRLEVVLKKRQPRAHRIEVRGG